MRNFTVWHADVPFRVKATDVEVTADGILIFWDATNKRVAVFRYWDNYIDESVKV